MLIILIYMTTFMGNKFLTIVTRSNLFPSNDSFGSSFGGKPFIKNCGITLKGVHNETGGRQIVLPVFIIGGATVAT